MQYFTSDYIDFFKELATNNHKEWFHSQKKRYENSVKKPFEAFVGDLIQAIKQAGGQLEIVPKDCILRINRDIRFSKDKTPYNLHRTAFVSKGGRKDKTTPGIFIRFAPDMLGIMGGAYFLEKDHLNQVRERIAQDPDAFRILLNDPNFQTKFGTLRGEAMKRIPKDWKAAVEQEPLVANKQFYFMAEREAELICSEYLLEEMMQYWYAMRPINLFLEKK